MNVREMIEADIADVFLNVDEFAEEIELEGKTFFAVVVNVENIEDKKGTIVGVVDADRIVYSKAENFPRSMKPGRLLTLNGKEMRLVKYAEAMGMGEAAVKQERTT